jgi:AraC-like DNA-binding protein
VTSITRMAQGGRWRTEAMRSYDRPVLIWFTRGQGRITIAGRSGGYGAHSAVFLPAGTMHGFTVNPAVLGSVVRLSEGDWPQEPAHLRLREVRLHRELTGMIDAIEREQNSGAADTDRAIAHHEGLLSIWFERTRASVSETDHTDPSLATALKLTEAFTSLVERDFNRPLGVQYYASKLGVTPTHLTRTCRKASGRAALDILSDRRHFEACRLLKDTDLAVSKIAAKSGFASPAYFTRAFRSRSGLSPTEFRVAK